MKSITILLLLLTASCSVKETKPVDTEPNRKRIHNLTSTRDSLELAERNLIDSFELANKR